MKISPKKEEESLYQKLAYFFGEIGMLDGFLQRRAGDIINKSKMLDYIEDGGNYLDIGFGLGHFIEQVLKHKNVTYWGIDPMLNASIWIKMRVNKTFPGKTKFLKGFGEKLPVKDHTLDGVSLIYVLHHVHPENQEQIFSEIKRTLKKGGHLFLVEDTPETEEEYRRNILWDSRLNFEPKSWNHYYKTPKEWENFLKKHDFQILKTSHFQDLSDHKKEGIIKHSGFVARLGKK
jgi:ubiquinone/menaquinone biosynthesis C-methylase UbiE